MQMKHIASLLLLSVFSTAAFSSNERELYTDGEWTLTDLDKKDPKALCIMYTQYELGSSIYRLEFAHSKSLPGPTDVQIRVQGKQSASSYTITLKDGTVLAFANMGEVVPKKQSMLWNIPQHTDRLISQFEDRKVLKLKPADASRDQGIEFSGDGFKRTRDKMVEKCMAGKPAYDQAFEDQFALNRDTINPLGISPDQTKELRRVLNAGYTIYLGINGTKADLIALTQKFQTQLSERDSLNSNIQRLGAVEIPSIITSQQNNDALEATSRTQLQQVTTTIAQQQSSLTAAQAQLNTARTIIAPYEAEHGTRETNAENARAAVNAGAQRLSEIDNGINAANYRINQLSSEAGGLQNANVRVQSDLNFARQNRMRAEMDARNFNPRDEKMRRLMSDPQYQQVRRDLPGLQNNVQILDSALNDARGKLIARQTELRVCQTRTSSFYKSSLERLPAQENPRGPRYNPNAPGSNNPGPGSNGPRPDGDRPDRPGRPGGDNTPAPTQPQAPSTPVPSTPAPTQPSTPAPTTPTAPTAVDCTAEQNSVNAAQQVVSTIEGQKRDAMARMSDAQNRMDSIERRVDMEVDRIRDDLQQRAMAAIRQQENLENQLAVNLRRIDVISNSEIPAQQNIINSLSAERPSVQARYNQDAPTANRLEGELAQFEQRVGWDAKVQAVQNAEALVTQRTNDLNRSLSQKSNLESQIARCQSERARLANLLVDTQNRKAQAEARLVVVLQSLVPYDQEKARLEQSQSDLQNQLATQAQDFESKLP